MFQHQEKRLLIIFSLLGSIFGFLVILLTIYHELTVKRLLKKIDKKL